MTLTRADLSQLNRRINLMRRGSPSAARDAAAELGHLASGQAVKHTLAAGVFDTGRYLRGWQEVHNQFAAMAGRPTLPIAPLRPSRYTGQNLDRLTSQVSHWTEIERRWALRRGAVEKHPRHALWPSYKQLVRSHEKVKKILGRARATLEVYRSGDGTALVIGGRRTKNAVSYSRLATLRTKVFGGRATVFNAAGTWWARGANLEPHARLVEYGIAKVARDQETGELTSTRVRARRIVTNTMRGIAHLVKRPDSAVKRAYLDHLRDLGAAQGRAV